MILRALGWLTLALTLRMLREGLLVRAVLWPGLLCAMVMALTAVGAAAWLDPRVAVEDPRWLEPLEALGFEPELREAPWEPLRRGDVPRAIWEEDGRVQLSSGGRLQPGLFWPWVRGIMSNPDLGYCGCIPRDCPHQHARRRNRNMYGGSRKFIIFIKIIYKLWNLK